jgi:cadmium resistance protein CadD (predicted permease)
MVAAAFGFVGTMVDNFFAFAAQLVVTPVERHRRISLAQLTAIGALVFASGLLASLLADIPKGWVALGAGAPWGLAWYGWRHRHDPPAETYRRGALTTFLLTVALGGDNLAVWMVLLRIGGVAHAVLTVVTFALCEAVFLFMAERAARHDRVVAWGQRWSPLFSPFLYLGLGVLIIVESGILG